MSYLNTENVKLLNIAVNSSLIGFNPFVRNELVWYLQKTEHFLMFLTVNFRRGFKSMTNQKN